MLVRTLFTLGTLAATGMLMLAFIWAGAALDVQPCPVQATEPADSVEPNRARPSRRETPAPGQPIPTELPPAEPTEPTWVIRTRVI